MRITLQPAFVLHHRPYRETSSLIDLFTYDHGRISLVARGVRKERSRTRAFLQPFQPLLVSFQGKGELMTLTSAEPQGLPLYLVGDCLLGSFYLNELLVRLLAKQDAYPQLYTFYHQTLIELQGNQLKQKYLRLFEKKLLDAIGYGLQLAYALPDKQPFCAEKFYYFHPQEGFYNSQNLESRGAVFSGKCILRLREEELEDIEIVNEIKRLMRMALAPLIGEQPLQSRKLFTMTSMTEEK